MFGYIDSTFRGRRYQPVETHNRKFIIYKSLLGRCTGNQFIHECWRSFGNSYKIWNQTPKPGIVQGYNKLRESTKDMLDPQQNLIS